MRRAEYDVRVIIAYRSATDVAAALTERNGFDPALGHLIWLRYLLEAERASREVPRVCVRYDCLLSNWVAEISRIETGLELRLPGQSQVRAEVDEFLAPLVRYHMAGSNDQAVDAASYTWTPHVHNVFVRWTRQSETLVER